MNIKVLDYKYFTTNESLYFDQNISPHAKIFYTNSKKVLHKLVKNSFERVESLTYGKVRNLLKMHSISLNEPCCDQKASQQPLSFLSV